MKLAIYGDSFAVDTYYTSWTRILVEKLQPAVYRNFACLGSSIDYSYHHFLKNHKDYDINIFIITDDSRSSLWYDEEPIVGLNDPNNVILLNKEKYNNLSIGEKKAIEKVYRTELRKRSFFPNMYCHYANAMIDSMKYHNPKVHLINAMFVNYSNLKHRNCMAKLQILDYEYHKISKFKLKKTYEKEADRANHISRQQNIEVADYMIQHIQGKIDIHDTFAVPEKYYTVSKTLESAGIGIKY